MANSTKTTMNDVVFNAAINEQIIAAAVAQSVFADKILTVQTPENGPSSVTMPIWDVMTVQTIVDGSAAEADAVSTSGQTITQNQYRIYAILTDYLLEESTGSLKPQFYAEAGRQLASNMDSVGLALSTSVSTTVGTSGVDLSSTDFLDGIYNLEANNAPDSVQRESLIGTVPSGIEGYVAILHPRQVQDLRNSIGNNAGALSANPGSFIYNRPEGDVMTPGYAFTAWDVPVFKSTHCPLSDTNANRNGIMMSPAAFGMAITYAAKLREDQSLRQAGEEITVTQKFGIAELVDTYAVRVRSDA